MKICGIYKIVNIIDYKMYIGQSADIYKRLNDHNYRLKCNKHINKHLQGAYNKYGKDTFKFEVYIECKPEELNDWEIFLIKSLDTNNPEYGYNHSSGGENAHIGCKHSEETKRKMSESQLGVKRGKQTIEHITKSAIARTGLKRTNEQNKRNSLSQFGKKVSKETKLKMSEARKNIILSEETKKRISKSMIGNKNSKGKIPWNKGKSI